MKTRTAIVVLAAAMAGCEPAPVAQPMADGVETVVGVRDVPLEVVERKSTGERFWITFREHGSGAVYERILVTDTQCKGGPENVSAGDILNVRFNDILIGSDGMRAEIDTARLAQAVCS